MLADQRQAARKILRVKAMILMDGGTPMAARTFDLGTTGMSVTTDHKVEIGKLGQVVFEMLVEGKPQLLTCRSKVTQCIFSGDEFKVGFAFQNLDQAVLTALTRFMR
ncbi:PilZ domain-containing protein [Massilia sp. MB5]|uniref:PilZ domain-containing protein n=1 Tax=unclassified Massilia TaxID=2609279 RepID=UPI00067BFB6D|nr:MULTISPECIES: PilZ domain-containing protein [unclassified Massilia]UMR28761.1 PilZ domain-containing protein [Massilia sp. MB5]